METPDTVGFVAESWETTAPITTQLLIVCPAYVKQSVKSCVCPGRSAHQRQSFAKDAHAGTV